MSSNVGILHDMVSAALLNFLAVITVQYLLFVGHALWVGKADQILRYTALGMAAGVLFGTLFDLVVGQYLGIFDYRIGYVWWFLAISGVFSYGVMMAHVFLLQKYRWFTVYVWAVVVGLVYEVANYLFPVWEWTFAASPVMESAVVVVVAYFGLAWLMLTTLRLAYNTQFRALPF